MEIPELSDDILLLICDQVRALDELSSATLFSAAVSTKRLAPLALSNLYRHARSPGTYDEFETGNASEAEQIIMKWAILWRSVYMATAGKSLYPYHTYLRFLDLRDLSNLIDHPHFKRKVEKYFFQGELSQYRARPVQILELFGDSILANNPVVEGVSGSITAEALQRWVPLMPRLRRLELWDGHVLANSQTQEAIYQNCPYFEELSIYSWTGQDTDSQLAPFISGLPQDSLSTLIVIRPCGISEKTVEALNRHGNSLKTLKLDLDPSEGAALGMLRACTSLESLSIQFSGTVDLEASEPDAAKQFSSFLGDCKSLKEVVFTNLKNAPTALVPLLLDEQIPLGDLVMSARTPFFGQHSETFNHALIQKKTLRSLHLQGEAQETTTTQIDGFVETSLPGIMENFQDDHIIRLLLGLDLLEEVYIGGYLLTDAVLGAIGSLKHLKRITIMGLSRFTLAGLLSFVDSLDEHGNDQLQLNVDIADPDHLLTTEEQDIVRAALKAKVQGIFEYTPLREEEGYGSDDLSD